MAIAAASGTWREREYPMVLVIDDDKIVRSLVRLHLANAGYTVTEAEDAVEGGHLALKEMPDLIVCDVDMPYMDGYEFVAALKSDALTQQIPVVFLSVRDDVAEHAGRLGAAAYLRKPVTADRLLQIVELYAARPLPEKKDETAC